MIDWTRLKLYNESKYFCFEQFCYQIAKTTYGDLGQFTNINDSGGGDGVEFYLKMDNGDVWGWQAKYYFPNTAFSSSRKRSMKESLKKSCEVHPDLKKWFLCLPSDLTPDKGKKKGQLTFVENELPKAIPNNLDVQIEPWTFSVFNDFVRIPQYEGIRNFFFGELEMSLSWFQDKYNREKYLLIKKRNYYPELHSRSDIETELLLFVEDNSFILGYYQYVKEKLLEFEGTSNEAINEIRIKFTPIEFNQIKHLILNLQIIMINSVGLTDAIICDITSKNDILVYEKQVNEFYDKFLIYLYELKPKIEDIIYADDRNREFRYDNYDLLVELHTFRQILTWSRNALKLIALRDLHVIGGTGMGKTHQVVDLANTLLDHNQPVIYIPAGNLHSTRNLSSQLIEILDVPRTYAFSDLLDSLVVASEVYKAPVIIILDALNEIHDLSTTRVVINDLEKFINKIQNINREIKIITTYRPEYSGRIWGDDTPETVLKTEGFEEADDAMQKYFAYFKIKPQFVIDPLNQFKRPIYLRLFCEVKNKERKEDVNVYIGYETEFEIIGKYIERVNKEICDYLNLEEQSILQDSLLKIARYMWINQSDEIEYKIAYELIDENNPNQISRDSFTSLVLRDDLILDKGVRYDNVEIIYFPLDIFQGYAISNYLISTVRPDSEYHRDIFSLIEILRIKILRFLGKLTENKLHQIFSNSLKIRRLFESKDNYSFSFDVVKDSLLIQFRQKTGYFLHYFSKHPMIIEQSLLSIFRISPSYVDENTLKLVFEQMNYSNPTIDKQNFLYETAKWGLFWLISSKDVNQFEYSPLANKGAGISLHFLNDILLAIKMTDRDLSWSRYLWENSEAILDFLISFVEELQLKDDIEYTSDFSDFTFLLSWFLSSNHTGIRDLSTHALYLMMRDNPSLILPLVHKLETVDDIYIQERLMAVIFGVTLYLFNVGKIYEYQSEFVDIAKWIYKMYFTEDSTHITSHVLLLDYVASSIRLICDCFESLKIQIDVSRLDILRNNYTLDNVDYSSSHHFEHMQDDPIHMDFGNYTLGSLFDDRPNYDYANPGYKKVKYQIYHIMENLGYSKRFSKYERIIGRDSHYRKERIGTLERLGKKYSWIAYYEIAGWRLFKGDFSLGDYKARIYQLKIDPTFPNTTKCFEFFKTLLVPAENEISEEVKEAWMNEKSFLELDEILVHSNLPQFSGNWALLGSIIDQKNDENNLRMVVIIRPIIVKNASQLDRDKIRLEPRGGLHPTSTSGVYYGEIPWSDNFDRDDDFYRAKYLVSRYKKPVKNYYLVISGNQGKIFNIKLNWHMKNMRYLFKIFGDQDRTLSMEEIVELFKLSPEMVLKIPAVEQEHDSILQKNDILDHKLDFEVEEVEVEVEDYKDIPSFMALRSYSFDGYTPVMWGSNPNLLSKEIGVELKLKVGYNGTEMKRDNETVYVHFENKFEFDNYMTNFSYISKETLEEYLRKSDSLLLYHIQIDKEIHEEGEYSGTKSYKSYFYQLIYPGIIGEVIEIKSLRDDYI